MKNVGVYCRISRDDNEISTSIENQQLIIKDYCKKNNLEITKVYSDISVSGFTMDRPQFKQLLQDVENGIINCIIAKDLSRLARKNVNLLSFLENMTDKGIQVLVLDENYNNMADMDSNGELLIGVKSLLNEAYVKDSSKKVKKSIYALQEEGRHLTSLPYGYIRTYKNKNEFVVDPQAAKIVQNIFEWYLEGNMGKLAIVEKLNELKITPPRLHYYNTMKAQGYNVKLNNSSETWSKSTINDILKNKFYTGCLVSRKTMKKGINGKKIRTDETEHLIFENHHEPIIDKQTFDMVQEIFNKRKCGKGFKGVRKQENIFVGLCKCNKCGSSMISKGEGNARHLICSAYNSKGRKECSNNTIKYNSLEKTIKMYLIKCRQVVSDNLETIDKKVKNELNKQGNGDVVKTIESLTKELNNENMKLKTLITQKTNEIVANPELSDIINDTYTSMINDKMLLIRSLKSQIENYKDMDIKTKDILTNLNFTLKVFDDIIASDNLSRKQISILIDKIEVRDDDKVYIYMKGGLSEIVEPQTYVVLSEQKQYIKAIVDAIYDDKGITSKDLYEYVSAQGFTYSFIGKFRRVTDMLKSSNFVVKDGHRFVPCKHKSDVYDALDLGKTCIEDTDNLSTPTINATIVQLINIFEWMSKLRKMRN